MSTYLVIVSGGEASIFEKDLIGMTFGGGDGTLDDPFIIEDVWGLQNMSTDLGAHYALGNHIDVSETSEWNDGAGFVRVGDDTTPFTGGFDGRNYTINGLFINRSTTDYVGLFGYIDGTTAGTYHVTASYGEVTSDAVTVYLDDITYQLTVNVDGQGSVIVDPDSDEYEEGTVVTLTASPDEGWEFVEWTGDATRTDVEITVTMDDNKTITAVFQEVDEHQPIDLLSNYLWLILLVIILVIVLVLILSKKKKSSDVPEEEEVLEEESSEDEIPEEELSEEEMVDMEMSPPPD